MSDYLLCKNPSILRFVVIESSSLPIHLFFDLEPGKSFSLGRNKSSIPSTSPFLSTSIHISSPLTSRHHASIFTIHPDSSLSSRSYLYREEKENGECMRELLLEPFASYVSDLGSVYGTFLNGTRLSDPKHVSKPYRLFHGDKITLPNTKFEVHYCLPELQDDIGHYICRPCNLLVHYPDSPSVPFYDKHNNLEKRQTEKNELTFSKEDLRRIEVDKIKKIYDINISNSYRKSESKESIHCVIDSIQSTVISRGEDLDWDEPSSSSSYHDRVKRLDSLSLAKSPVVPIPLVKVSKKKKLFHGDELNEENKGFQMLQRLGWTQGQTLGLSGGEGLTTPILLDPKKNRKGLG